MKKNLFFVALAAVALVSCSSEDLIEDVVEEAQTPIEFVGTTQNVTRAGEIKNEKALALGGGFAVYGYKYKTGLSWTNWDDTATGNVIFKNKNVTTTASSTDAETKADYTWTYSGTKYWDKTAAYKFYAIAPYEETATANYTLSTDGKFTITNVASGIAADSKDYIIDRVVNDVAASTTHSAVAFDFHHIMAKVDFKLAKASTLQSTDEVKVSSITMSGWDNATATFTQSKVDGTWGVLDCSEWTRGSAVAGNVEILTGTTDALGTTAATSTSKTFIMVPQPIEANKLTFTINYTLNGEPFTAQTGVVAGAQIWGTDSHVTYTITVGPEAITFDVATVCDFCLDGNTAKDASNNTNDTGATVK